MGPPCFGVICTKGRVLPAYPTGWTATPCASWRPTHPRRRRRRRPPCRLRRPNLPGRVPPTRVRPTPWSCATDTSNGFPPTCVGAPRPRPNATRRPERTLDATRTRWPNPWLPARRNSFGRPRGTKPLPMPASVLRPGSMIAPGTVRWQAPRLLGPKIPVGRVRPTPFAVPT